MCIKKLLYHSEYWNTFINDNTIDAGNFQDVIASIKHLISISKDNIHTNNQIKQGNPNGYK